MVAIQSSSEIVYVRSSLGPIAPCRSPNISFTALDHVRQPGYVRVC